MAQTNAATFPFNFDDGYTILHSNAKVDILVKNQGSAPIQSISYTVEDFVSGSVSSEKTTTLTNPIPAGEEGETTFRIPAGSETGVCLKIVTMTRINGEVNEASAVEASANGKIHTMSEKVSKRTLEEEYTGTWCGWCPRGMVGMELLQQKYPDTFVGIAYHYDDPMYISSNGYHDGFPSAILNRHSNVDPYFGMTGTEPFGIDKSFVKEQNILPEAALEATAQWANASRTQVNVKSQMRFVLNSEETYAMAYFVTEDGMTGSTWVQSNYYNGNSKYADDPYMADWYNGNSYVRGIAFNHVAVASFGRESGIEGSVASPATIGMTQEHQYTLDLSGATTIQNKDHLHVIASLINTTTGCVINSFRCEITPDEEAHIQSVSVSPTASRLYDLQGRLVETPRQGQIYLKR